MTAAASSTRSGSIFAATSDEPYPSARVSKIAESWRSTPSSFTRATRARTSASSLSSRSASTAYGRGSRGKSHWTAFSSSRSASSSWSTCNSPACGSSRSGSSLTVMYSIVPRPTAPGKSLRVPGLGRRGARGRARITLVAELEAHWALPAVAVHGDVELLTRLAPPDLAHQLGDTRDRGRRTGFPDVDDHVSLHEPRVGGRAAGHDALYACPAAGAVGVVGGPDAEPAVLRAPACGQLRGDVACLVDRERQPRGGGVRRHDEYADDLAPGVDERAARVLAARGHVGLDETGHRDVPTPHERSVERSDLADVDPAVASRFGRRHAANLLTCLEACRRPELRGLHARPVDRQDGEIGDGVAGVHRCGQRAAVGRDDGHRVRAVDGVRGRDDLPRLHADS